MKIYLSHRYLNQFFIYIIQLFIFIGCKENEIDVITDKNLLWYQENVKHHLNWKIEYNEMILFYTKEKGSNANEFKLVDPYTGSERSLNSIVSDENSLYGYAYNESNAIIRLGSKFLFIDLLNGEITQETIRGTLPVIHSNEGYFIVLAHHLTHKQRDILKINLFTRELSEVYAADLKLPESFDVFFPLGGYSNVDLYSKSGNLNSLLLYGEYYGDSTNGRHWIDFIDPLSLNKQSDSIPIIGNTMHTWIDETNDKLYVLTSAFYSEQYMVVVYGIDLLVKDIIWEKQYKDVVWGGGMVLAEDKLFYIIDGVPEGTMYCVEPQTGRHLWVNKTKAGVLTSQLQELNGIIYFTSINSGRIHAVDIITGQDLWNKRPPVDYGSYTTACYVVEGKEEKKGVVIGITLDEIFAYEAIK